MTLTKRNHVLICLDGNYYSRKVLLRGASLAKKDGYTFEVIYFYPNKNGCTIFQYLNIVESKNLSKRLGATKFTLKKIENEKNKAKELINVAKDKNVKEIVMSGEQNRSDFRNAFLRKFFSFNKFNYIERNLPDTVLVLINHFVFNPFEQGEYESGRKGYLVKRKRGDVKTQYVFSDKPFSSRKNIVGLFFQRKGTDGRDGLFACFHNGRLMYVFIRNGKLSTQLEDNAKQFM